MSLRSGLILVAAVTTFLVLLWFNAGETIRIVTSGGPVGVDTPGATSGRELGRIDIGPNWLVPIVGAGAVLVGGLIIERRRRGR